MGGVGAGCHAHRPGSCPASRPAPPSPSGRDLASLSTVGPGTSPVPSRASPCRCADEMAIVAMAPYVDGRSSVVRAQYSGFDTAGVIGASTDGVVGCCLKIESEGSSPWVLAAAIRLFSRPPSRPPYVRRPRADCLIGPRADRRGALTPRCAGRRGNSIGGAEQVKLASTLAWLAMQLAPHCREPAAPRPSLRSG